MGLYRVRSDPCTCRTLQACEKVSLCGEQVVLCLEQQIWQHNRAAETSQEVAGIYKDY